MLSLQPRRSTGPTAPIGVEGSTTSLSPSICGVISKVRFFYHNEGNPRMDYLNSTLRQPLLFAPANAVKAMTFAYFYSAGPKPLAQMLCRGTPNHLTDQGASLVT